MSPSLSGSPTPKDRELLEKELLEQTKTAEQAYRAASAEYAKTMAEHGHMLDDPNGASAVHRAACHERAMLQAYTRALKAFCDLVVHGRRP